MFILKSVYFYPSTQRSIPEDCVRKEKDKCNTTQEAEKVYTPLKCSGNYTHHLL